MKKIDGKLQNNIEKTTENWPKILKKIVDNCRNFGRKFNKIGKKWEKN